MDDLPLPSDSSDKPGFLKKAFEFFERPMTGIAVGIVIGAVGALASVKFLLCIAWAVLVVSIAKEKWKVPAKFLSVLLAGVVLFAIWHFTPKPKQSPTAEENAEAIRRILPWPPPSSVPPPQKDEKSVRQGKTESFAVQVEAEISRFNQDTATPFWTVYRSIDGCSVSPSDIVLYIRIENLKSVNTMITAYTVDVEPKKTQGTLINLDTLGSQVVFLGSGGNGPGGGVVQIPAGNYLTEIPLSADRRKATVLDLDTLDKVLSNKLLASRQIVRAWALFEYPHPYSIPVDITVNLTDEFEHTYSYTINLNQIVKRGDIMPHTSTVRQSIDLSGCTLKHF